MANPYASTGSVSTVAASAAGDRRSLPDALEAPAMGAGEVLRRLWGFMGGRRSMVAAAALVALATVGMQLYVPILVGQAIDCIVGAGRVDFAALAPLVIRAALLIAGASGLQLFQGLLINKIGYGVVRDARVAAAGKLTRLPMGAIDGHARGDYLARVVNDAEQVGDGLLQGMLQLLTGSATIVGTLVFMVGVSGPMALAVALATPLSIAASMAIARLSAGGFAEQQRLQGRVAAHIEEYAGCLDLVRSFGYADRAEAEFDELNAALSDVGERAQFVSSLSNPGSRFVNNIIYAIVAVLGCICVITGSPAPLTVGGVQVFLAYASQYAKPFNEVAGVIGQVQAALASAARLFELLDAEEEREGGALDLGPARGEVVFDHVEFGYEPGHPVLRDVSFRARPGARIALVGPTGCGKTTLINLLLRFYDADAGSIFLDGVDIRSLDRSALRRRFGMVLQDTWLFEGTVRENIAYGAPGAADEEVVRAAERARARHFIEALPKGFDTEVEEGGGSLSMGQRQLVCIARAMLADPAVLLLDEATSSIDTRTERQVQEAFDELMSDRTSIVVAHRLSTIRDADCILVMRDGRIVERGTHAGLLAENGFYAELHRSQFEERDLPSDR